MSSFAWDKEAKAATTAETESKDTTAATNDTTRVAATTGMNDNVSDISDANSMASDANSKTSKQEPTHANGKKRKKAKRAKTEEKEDGELDDENDDNNSQLNYDDDYDDYDFDEDSKNSRDNVEGTGTGRKSPPVNISKAEKEPSVVGQERKSQSPTEDVAVSVPVEVTKSLQATNRTLEASATQQQPPNFQIPNPYDIEYEDYDSDDDDYGNSKRLKIDESEDPAVETTETKSEASVDPKPLDPPVESNNQVNSNKKEDITTVLKKLNGVPAAEQPENQTKDSGVEASKPEIEHDNEASNSSSVASSKSASSAMTAISAISSDSLPVSASSACDKSSQDCDVKQLQQLVDTQDIKIGNATVTSSEEDAKPEKDKMTGDQKQENADSKQLDQQEDSKSSDTDSLKVPSLKIIVSGNGSLPYVKGQPTTAAVTADAAVDSEVSANIEQRATRNEKKQRAAAAANKDTVTTPVKNGDSTPSNVNDSPANNSRSKSTRSTRVASPVTTSYKGTPTRRSAAAAAAAALNTTGRSSPSTTTTSSSSRTNELKESTKDNSTSKKEPAIATTTASSNTDIHTSSLSNSSTSSTTAANNNNENNNAADASTAAGRRKLRSSGRLGVDDFPAVEKVQRSTSTKSPSPVTIMNENANSYNNEAEATAQPASGTIANPKLPLAAEASELSNSSMVDSDSNITPSISLSLSDFFPGTRKKRNRQVQQQLQEQLDLINEIDTLNALAASASEYYGENDPKSEGKGNQGDSQQSNDSGNSDDDTGESKPVLFNCIQKILDLKNDLARRREALMQIKLNVKLPKNFNEFFMYKKTYLIKNNKEAQKSIPFFKPPENIPDDLKSFFFKQEKERYSLRLRHRVEQDKLIILYEQEILRSFNKAARDTVNQKIPFSFCSMIKDDEIYNAFRISEKASMSVTTAPTSFNNIDFNSQDEQQQQQQQVAEGGQADEVVETADGVVQQRVVIEPPTAEEVFVDNLVELRTKFQKLKDDCIKRQLNESDSLQAVQKMDFQSKIKELTNKYKNAATNGTTGSNANSAQTSPASVSHLAAVSLNAYNILIQFQQTDIHVPIVHVNNKFDLLDAQQNNFIDKNSPPSTSTTLAKSIAVGVS